MSVSVEAQPLTYQIHGIKGFCGEEVAVKVWKNGTSLRCTKGEVKASVII